MAKRGRALTQETARRGGMVATVHLTLARRLRRAALDFEFLDNVVEAEQLRALAKKVDEQRRRLIAKRAGVSLRRSEMPALDKEQRDGS